MTTTKITIDTDQIFETVLVEDAASDTEINQLIAGMVTSASNAIYQQRKETTWNIKAMSRGEIFGNQALIIKGRSLKWPEPFTDLMLILGSGSGHNAFYHTSTKANGNKPFIFMNVLHEGDYKGDWVASALKAMSHPNKRDTLFHELVHAYQDTVQNIPVGSSRNSPKDADGKETDESYYNNPVEFDARARVIMKDYTDAIETIKKHIGDERFGRDDIDEYLDLMDIDLDFSKEMEKFGMQKSLRTKSAGGILWLKALPENRKKLIKRLYRVHQSITELANQMTTQKVKENMAFYETLLMENKAQYKSMIEPLVKSLNGIGLKEQAQDVLASFNTMQKILQRNDRIVWWIKHYRAAYAHGIMQQPLFDELGDEPKSQFEKIAQRLNKGVVLRQAEIDALLTSRFQTRMEHYSSYWTKDEDGTYLADVIANYTFENDKSLTELWNELATAEKEWADNRKQIIPHATDEHPNATKILDFNDGYSWWSLGTHVCSSEASSMGHCGNEAHGQEGQDILSLRQEVKGGKHKPAATFILDADGLLGEMKGRANQKPAQVYHKYITALLRHDIIKGIRTSGYASESDFSISDLDDEERDALAAEKPSLVKFNDTLKMHPWGSSQVSHAIKMELNDSIDELDGNWYTVDDKTYYGLLSTSYSDLADEAEGADELEKLVLGITVGDIDLSEIGDYYPNPSWDEDEIRSSFDTTAQLAIAGTLAKLPVGVLNQIAEGITDDFLEESESDSEKMAFCHELRDNITLSERYDDVVDVIKEYLDAEIHDWGDYFDSLEMDKTEFVTSTGTVGRELLRHLYANINTNNGSMQANVPETIRVSDSGDIFWGADKSEIVSIVELNNEPADDEYDEYSHDNNIYMYGYLENNITGNLSLSELYGGVTREEAYDFFTEEINSPYIPNTFSDTLVQYFLEKFGGSTEDLNEATSEFTDKAYDPGMMTWTEFRNLIDPQHKSHPSDAYDMDVETIDRLARFRENGEEWEVINQITVEGRKFEVIEGRSDNWTKSFVKTDADREIVRDSSGNAVMQSVDELKQRFPGDERYDYEYYIRDTEDDKFVGKTANEWGTLLVTVAQEYRGMGFGPLLVTKAREKDPTRQSGGFTYGGKANAMKAHTNAVRGYMASGFYSMLVKRGDMTTERAKEITQSIGDMKAKPKPNPGAEKQGRFGSKKPSDWGILANDVGVIIFDRSFYDAEHDSKKIDDWEHTYVQAAVMATGMHRINLDALYGPDNLVLLCMDIEMAKFPNEEYWVEAVWLKKMVNHFGDRIEVGEGRDGYTPVKLVNTDGIKLPQSVVNATEQLVKKKDPYHEITHRLYELAHQLTR